MSQVIDLESDEEVNDFIEKGGRVLYFTASWCKPCKIFGPRIEKAANENQTPVGKVNVDFATGSLHKYHIRGVPTVIRVNHNGDMQAFESGVRDVEFIKTFIG